MYQQPTFTEERKLWEDGHQYVAGIDEVGRGPLAGPVVAAAVILSPRNESSWLLQVRDSKKLTPRKREFLSACIRKEAVAVGIGVVHPEIIDAEGILAATKSAMRSAVERLAYRPHFLLLDAITLPEINIPQMSIVKGDNLSLSIAAASIVAKVHRDNFMVECDGHYPGYGFARHKGYPTMEHLTKLRHLGCCPIHRSSFAPVRAALERDGQ